jgi:hypothetical protein
LKVKLRMFLEKIIMDLEEEKDFGDAIWMLKIISN